MGMSLDYGVGVRVVSSQGPHKKEAGGSESEMEEVALLAMTMEEMPQPGCGTSRNWKRPETISLGFPEGMALPEL